MFCQDSSLYRHVFTVLPKFEVKLDVPSALHYEDILTGTVTAKWAIVLYSSLIIYIYIYALVFTFLSALAFPGNPTHDLGVASALLYYFSYRKADYLIETQNSYFLSVLRYFYGKPVSGMMSVIYVHFFNGFEKHHQLKETVSTVSGETSTFEAKDAPILNFSADTDSFSFLRKKISPY